MPERLFQPGDIVFKPGDSANEAYLIHSGSVEVLADSGGRLLHVALCGPGDIFGEMSLIEEWSRWLTARVCSPCRATPLSRAEFLHFMTSNPEQCHRYLRSLFARLRKSNLGPGGAKDPQPQLTPLFSVTIRPLTIQAAQSLPGEILSVGRYPFRIGRAMESLGSRVSDSNDLSILDTQPFNVSRTHAAIDMIADGSLVVVDRGSHLGTIVNEQRLRGDSFTRQAKLLAGDNSLVLGGRQSPFRFCIRVG